MNNDENKDFIIINENGENVTPEDNLKKHEDEREVITPWETHFQTKF